MFTITDDRNKDSMFWQLQCSFSLSFSAGRTAMFIVVFH